MATASLDTAPVGEVDMCQESQDLGPDNSTAKIGVGELWN